MEPKLVILPQLWYLLAANYACALHIQSSWRWIAEMKISCWTIGHHCCTKLLCKILGDSPIFRVLRCIGKHGSKQWDAAEDDGCNAPACMLGSHELLLENG